MYRIDSKVDKPDIGYLRAAVERAVVKRGVRLDGKVFELRKSLNFDVNDKLRIFRGEYGLENPNSQRQLESCLLRVLDEEELSVLREKDGKLTTKKEYLERLADEGNRLALDLLEYRYVKKRVETIDSLLLQCDKYGLLHPNITLGDTNRINYEKPALMNIQKDILWDIIRPYKDGASLISIDIKNQEPMILINWLCIESLKEAYRKYNCDLYSGIFDLVYGRMPSEEERAECKVAWNALTYGTSKRALKDMCMLIDADEIYSYFNKIPELKSYRSKCYAYANNKIRACRTYFGTPLRATARQVGQLSRQLMDYPVQGTGSDILSLLVRHFETEGIAEGLSLYYTRHDELILEASKEYMSGLSSEELTGRMREIFQHQVDDWEPFQIEVSVL